MSFMPVFKKMVELFLIIIMGYIGNKTGVFGTKAKQMMSKLVLSITLPCLILSSVMNSESIPKGAEITSLIVVAFSSYLVLFALAKFTAWIMRFKGQQKGAVEFGIMFANVGFIGYPVTEAIFGSQSAFYTTIFNLPFNILCYSVGVSMITGTSVRQMFAGKDRKETAALLKKLFLTPTMIASAISLLIAFTGIQGPDLLAQTFTITGNVTTPGALLIIGSTLADMPVKEMFSDVRSYLFVLFACIITPLVIALVYYPFIGSNDLLLGEAVIIAAMPVGTAGTMLCVEYGGDDKLMARNTFLTTLASVVTIPLITMLLGML